MSEARYNFEMLVNWVIFFLGLIGFLLDDVGTKPFYASLILIIVGITGFRFTDIKINRSDK